MPERNIISLNVILIKRNEKNKKFKNSIRDLIVKIFNNSNN